MLAALLLTTLCQASLAADSAAIRKAVEDPAAEKIIDGTLASGSTLTVDAENGITAAADLELLRSVKDESTMRTIAARIAATNGTDTPPITAPGPRPDLTQGATGTPAAGSPEQDFASFLSRQMAG